ncbi:MAG TPA: tRNA pseudouridine(55) synthase TruB [Pseudolysinimonas sp.]|nr:tRNA pseudouridine(55) synthase TruB [Pseudolysinimonas sp.]
MNETSPTGILLVDKPQGITSHDVVARARRALGTRKVGHAGTLDPMATGLLVLGVGSSTRLLSYVVGLDKDYEATIRLGQSSDTDDADGEISAARSTDAVSADALATGIAALTGSISQVPSTFSAIKVDGRRSYDLARAGHAVELASRAVTVSRFEVRARREATVDGTPVIDLDVAVTCSSGTYIRALARDLGSALGVGGHLTALRRTRIGPFVVADATVLESQRPSPDEPSPIHAADLRTAAATARQLFPTLALDESEAVALSQGKRLAVDVPDAAIVAALAPDGHLVGLVSVTDGEARVLVNFPTEGRVS